MRITTATDADPAASRQPQEEELSLLDPDGLNCAPGARTMTRNSRSGRT